jgi:aminopeptidase
MYTENIQQLAQTIINYSLSIQKGEKLLIEVKGQGTDDMLKALIQETLKVGGIPYWNRNQDEILNEFIACSDDQQMQTWSSLHKIIMENIDAYVAIRGTDNAYELSNVPAEHMKSYMKNYFEQVHSKIRVPKKKWVVLRWPNFSMAQLAQMNTADFAKFYFETCTLDYSQMGSAMVPLVELMKKTDKVRLVGPGKTDISFSIKNIPVHACAGKLNIPDGEVYTAPVKDSMNGLIAYNTPSFYNGKLFSNVCLEVKNGQIQKATCDGDHQALNAVFDTDQGARYFGEFAIGVNPHITFAMKDTLFDEKIYGSIHLTPGSSYDNAFNGNKSAVHWDLVMIQTPDFGGGEIYFDDLLIRRDGEFILPELQALNKK